ncbi:MAG: 6-bladed beta-propeller [Acidobacteria bacterium]|jgi:hypothetical protein|nr:6-bladed beta-propeller [Acidobacteriota bacterium]
MKFLKWYPVIVLIALSTGINLHAQVVSNPGKPAALKAGRVAKVTEVLRIRDDGKNFFFKFPSIIKVAADGTIFVADKDQLLRFDKEGKFFGNLQKKGEGPGEYFFASDFNIIGDRIFTSALIPSKILEFDWSGKLIKETRRTRINGIPQILDINKDKYYYVFCEFNPEQQKTGLVDFKQNLFVSTFDGNPKDLALSFPIRRSFVSAKAANNQMMVMVRDIDFFCFAVENENSLYVSHSPKYLVKHIDMANGKIIGQFTREYNPVVYVPKESDKKNTEFVPREFFPDIEQLAMYKGNLLVLTSTLDEKKGILVDLFNKEGKYLDNFYLPLPKVSRPDAFEKSPFVVWEDFIFLVERDEDENLTIVKYKLEI